MPLEFVRSKRGCEQLLHKGFVFRKERTTAAKTIWRCAEICKGRCHTVGDEVVFHSDNHNHVPNVEDIVVRRMRDKIKQRAKEKSESAQEILVTLISEQPEHIQSILPSVSAMTRIIQRVRKGCDLQHTIPTSTMTINIPERCKVTTRGEPFLFYDSRDTHPDEPRFLIFSSPVNLNMLVNCSHWYADGAFKTTSPLLTHVWTIHGLQRSTLFPTVHALLAHKTQEIFLRVLEALKSVCSEFSPETVILDFEEEESNAFKSAFPDVTVRGCFFHFCQAMWRRIQTESELMRRYTAIEEDCEWPVNIRKLFALTFVPADDVILAYDQLVKTEFFSTNEDFLDGLMSYFEEDWVGKTMRSGSRQFPKYDIPLWNQYTATLEGLFMTNKAIERWHRTFSPIVHSYHVDIAKFIDTLRTEEEQNEKKVKQYFEGTQPTGNRKSDIDMVTHLEHIVHGYDQANVINYLNDISQLQITSYFINT